MNRRGSITNLPKTDAPKTLPSILVKTEWTSTENSIIQPNINYLKFNQRFVNKHILPHGLNCKKEKAEHDKFLDQKLQNANLNNKSGSIRSITSLRVKPVPTEDTSEYMSPYLRYKNDCKVISQASPSKYDVKIISGGSRDKFSNRLIYDYAQMRSEALKPTLMYKQSDDWESRYPMLLKGSLFG